MITVIVFDSIFLLRLVPALLTLWKPKHYISFYRLYRIATCLGLITLQVVLLFVNLFHSKILIKENQRLTAWIHVLILFATSIVDSACCWVVSTTLISTIKSQRKMFAKQKGRQLQKGEHKGAIRIDTPPPSIDVAASSIFRRTKT